MPHVVAAPDKFRGTASAAEVAGAVTRAADRAHWTSAAVPLSDGGEGLLDAVGGSAQWTTVPGPLGEPVRAEWRLLPAADHGVTAVVEMSRASGRALLPHPRGGDPVRADTTGVGLLLLAARDAGAARIVIGCGGSATTDGGWGAVRAVEAVGSAALSGVELVVAGDVTTPFREAAAVFGPQKGASPDQVALLTERLATLADRYRQDFGVDVDAMVGTGAAGGLAGGLVALGARIRPGFDLVADMCGLDETLRPADLVITGEGHVDLPSFEGKVPGGVLARVAGRCPVLCIAGGVDPAVVALRRPGLALVSLTSRFGRTRSHAETLALISEVTSEALAGFASR